MEGKAEDSSPTREGALKSWGRTGQGAPVRPSNTKVIPIGKHSVDGNDIDEYLMEGDHADELTFALGQVDEANKNGESGKLMKVGMHYHRSKFMRSRPFGSRMVGGKRPTNMERYKSYESVSYMLSDTAHQEGKLMRMTSNTQTLHDRRAENSAKQD